MSSRALALAVGAVVLGAPASAGAATASVNAFAIPTGLGSLPAQQARYVAAPGEANRLTVTVPPAEAGDAAPSVRFTDPGAVITPGAGCVAGADAHTVTCTFAPGDARLFARAELGDGADTLRACVGTFTSFLTIVGLGGPGNDDLAGGAGDDQLDGGGGTDSLQGGDGSDTLTDGDTDAVHDADTIIGAGDGSSVLSYQDAVSYAGRKEGVTVDLAAKPPTGGAPGEGDKLIGIDSVTGGSGDDVIRGDGGFEGGDFRGGPGDDRIDGSAGEDSIDGGPGDDHLDDRGGGSGELEEQITGGPGRDVLVGSDDRETLRPGSGFDRYTCGREADTVIGPQPRERVARKCDQVTFEFAAFVSVDHEPTGERRRRVVRQRIGCPDALNGPVRADASVTLRQRGGKHRRLGRVAFACRATAASSSVRRIRLTKRGARLARRKGGVLVALRVKMTGLPDQAWSYRLK